jgi:hypothetical protein
MAVRPAPVSVLVAPVFTRNIEFGSTALCQCPDPIRTHCSFARIVGGRDGCVVDARERRGEDDWLHSTGRSSPRSKQVTEAERAMR